MVTVSCTRELLLLPTDTEFLPLANALGPTATALAAPVSACQPTATA